MRISVVVPLYNKAPVVARCLRSIAAQTHQELEIIVVDDGSTDHGRAVAEMFDDPRVRVLNQRNQGPGAARNRGLADVKTSLVAFLDADDEWHPEFLARNLTALAAAGPEVAAVSCGYIEEPAGVDRATRWRARGIREGAFVAAPNTDRMRFVHAVAYVTPCNTLARTDVLRSLGGFYAQDRCVYAEDAWLWCQLLLTRPVLFHFAPLLVIHTEDSALSNNSARVRPVEPFLLHPEPLFAACPPHLRPLLRDFLAVRAFKTACVLGYWGRWREAGALVRRFAEAQDYATPYLAPALVASTPLGGALGGVWRRLQRARGPLAAAVDRGLKRLLLQQ
jgi:glycosyltransferase involved in cell wall biosynthesis